ncbi:MAG: TonB-dependent receptor [Erythrobacter sp.]
MNTRSASRRVLALAMCTTAMMPFAAHAQDTDQATETPAPAAQQRASSLDSITEILVTGTKTRDAENVQDIPFAVTAFNEGTLEAFKIRDISGLSFQVPSVSLDQIGTARGTANFTIRGVGINSSIPSIDPTVGVFVDGVFMGINGGLVFDLFDLDSVEILRGPQGVLFGRNVTGGAVVINTGNPTDQLSGKFRAAVDGPVDSGRGGANYTTSAVLSGPLIEDKLLFKVGAYYNKDEGYFRNLFDGSNQGAADTTIIRGALEARLGNLNLLAKLDYFTSEGDGPAAQNRGIFDRNSFDLAIDNRGFYTNDIWTGSFTATWDIGPGTLTNIVGYRNFSSFSNGDIDATVLDLFHSDARTEQEQWSNELRYAISTDRMELVFGGFYFNQDLAYDEIRFLQRATPTPPPTFFGGGRQNHEVLGLFVNTQYKLTNSLSLLAGIRWNQETKDGDVTFIRPRGACSVVDLTCPFTGTNPLSVALAGTQLFPNGPEDNGFNDRLRFENLSPKLGLQYEWAASQVYGHWSRGFRSGGFNFRITDVAVFQRAVAETGSFGFDEERVDTFEIGGKFQTLDGAFTLNAAAYVTFVDNMQREVNLSDPGLAVVQNIINTADATIKGIEAEARMRLSSSLIFTANLGLIDAAYDRVIFDISGDGVIDDQDLALSIPRVPPVTVGAGLIHELFLKKGSIVSRVNYQYRDRAAFTDDNFGWLNDFSMLEANITWNTPVEGLSLSLYGRNLLDQARAGGDTQVPFGGPLSTGVQRPFQLQPGGGTFSPLLRGRDIGLEVMFAF